MTHHRLWLARRCVYAGADLGHIEALLSNSWPLSEHQVQEGKTRSGPPAWRERRDRQGGKKRSHTETLSVEAQLGSGAQASSSEQVEKQNFAMRLVSPAHLQVTLWPALVHISGEDSHRLI